MLLKNNVLVICIRSMKYCCLSNEDLSSNANNMRVLRCNYMKDKRIISSVGFAMLNTLFS